MPASFHVPQKAQLGHLLCVATKHRDCNFKTVRRMPVQCMLPHAQSSRPVPPPAGCLRNASTVEARDEREEKFRLRALFSHVVPCGAA